MKHSGTLRHYAPFWLSIAAGIALWEIAGRNTSAAFMVPFSETIVRLWQLVESGEFVRQLIDSAKLFLTGFVLAVIVGLPFGMLLARLRPLRVGIEPFLMIIYATPLVALIPFILSMMGFGFAPKVLVVFLFAVFSVIYNTVEGARSIKSLPLDAGGDAELVLFGVRHSDPPGSPEALHAFVDAMSAEFLQSVDLGFDVVNHNVEVHAVLARLGFGYA